MPDTEFFRRKFIYHKPHQYEGPAVNSMIDSHVGVLGVNAVFSFGRLVAIAITKGALLSLYPEVCLIEDHSTDLPV